MGSHIGVFGGATCGHIMATNLGRTPACNQLTKVVSVHLKLGISYHIYAKEALVAKAKQNTASIEPPYNAQDMKFIDND
jgi:hypothetical protein